MNARDGVAVSHCQLLSTCVASVSAVFHERRGCVSSLFFTWLPSQSLPFGVALSVAVTCVDRMPFTNAVSALRSDLPSSMSAGDSHRHGTIMAHDESERCRVCASYPIGSVVAVVPFLSVEWSRTSHHLKEVREHDTSMRDK